MARRFGVGAAVLAAMLWLGVGPAQAINDPIPGIDIVVKHFATVASSGAVVAMETITLERGGGATFDLGPGHWIITTECHGGGTCAPHAFTGLRLNGRQIDLPGPTEELELRFDEAGGVRRVWLPPVPVPPDSVNGIGGTGGGRLVFRPTRRTVISDGTPGGAAAAPRADTTDEDRGGDGGGAAGGGAP